MSPIQRHVASHISRLERSLVNPLQIPSHKLNALLLSKVPQVLQALLAQINVLHVGRILCRGFADSTCDNDGVCLKNDAVVDDLVDCQCDEVVVVVDGALVCRVPRRMSVAIQSIKSSAALLQEDGE